jgi:hypothetical protein
VDGGAWKTLKVSWNCEIAKNMSWKEYQIKQKLAVMSKNAN